MCFHLIQLNTIIQALSSKELIVLVIVPYTISNTKSKLTRHMKKYNSWLKIGQGEGTRLRDINRLME
jgi:hypothetical protein